MTHTPTSIRSMESHAIAEWFVDSACVLFPVVALTLFWCNWDNQALVPPFDPLLGCSLKTLFWIVGSLLMVVSLICLIVDSLFPRLLLITWLAANFALYQFGLFCIGSHAIQACFGYVSLTFGISLPLLDLFARGALIYLLAGSIFFIVCLRLEKNCPACGGIIRFSIKNRGRKNFLPALPERNRSHFA